MLAAGVALGGCGTGSSPAPSGLSTSTAVAMAPSSPGTAGPAATSTSSAAAATSVVSPAPAGPLGLAGLSLTLLGAGAEPRARLRLALAKEADQTLEISASLGPGSDVKLPQTPDVVLGLQVTERRPDGSAVVAVRQKGGRGYSPAVAARRTLFLVLSDRGFVTDGWGEIAGNRQPLSEREKVESEGPIAYPTLPDEPVGRGARWSVRRTLASKEVETRTFEIAALDAARVSLRLDIERAPPEPPASAAGFVRYKGSGTCDIDLTRPAPLLEEYLLVHRDEEAGARGGQLAGTSFGRAERMQLRSK